MLNQNITNNCNSFYEYTKITLTCCFMLLKSGIYWFDYFASEHMRFFMK